jgi:hypothetical protein
MPHPIEVIAPGQPFERLPATLVQRSSLGAFLAVVLLLIPAAIPTLVLLWLTAAFVSEPAEAFAVLKAKPLAGVQILLAMVIWTALFLVPLRRLLSGIGLQRTVTLDGERVSVAERGPFREQSWTLPLSAYRGVAHHIRATLSGTRHELVLVHPDARYSLLFYTADRMPSGALETVTALLRLPAVPAGELYRRQLTVPGWWAALRRKLQAA